MISKLLFVFLILVCLPVHSDDSKRKSYLGFNMDYSSNEYRNYFLSGARGIDPTWQLGVSSSRSEDEDSNKYQSGALFVSANWNDIFSNKIKLSASKERPDEITGKGGEFTTRASYPVISSDMYTSLELTLGAFRYEQEIVSTRSLGTFTATRDFIQRYVAIDLSQDLATWLLLGLRFTKYSYEDASSASFTGKNNKFQASQSVDGVADYPDKKAEVYSTLFFKKLSIDISLQKTSSNISQGNSLERSLVIAYSLGNNWEVSGGVSSIKYEDESKSDTFSLGVDYTF